MATIVYRGTYATFPMVGLNAGDLAYATDLLVLFEWSGTAGIPYYDFPDYQGGKVGVLSESEWAATEGREVNFGGIGIPNRAFGESTSVTYTVPAGRTLYITQFSISNEAVAAADGDNNQICIGVLEGGWAFTVVIGGNGGANISFPKPIRAVAGTVVIASCTNRANHTTKAGVTFSGYEI